MGRTRILNLLYVGASIKNVCACTCNSSVPLRKTCNLGWFFWQIHVNSLGRVQILKIIFLCPRHKMARGHLVFALSVLPSFHHSVIPSHQSLSSQLLPHLCMDLNETWQGCCTTSLEVHVGRLFMFGEFWQSYGP